METIRCRTNPKYWWTVLLALSCAELLIYAGIFIPPDLTHPSPSIFIIVGPMMLICGLSAIYLALSLMREEIVADETGLRWRGAFGPWKSALWEEISDFYLSGKPTRISPVQTAPRFTRPTVETPHGQLKIDRSFTNLSQLMPFIAARAVNAPARVWEIFELRAAQNFSQRFDYWTKTKKWTTPIVLLAVVYEFVVLGWSLWSAEVVAPGLYKLSLSHDVLSIGMILARFIPIIILFVSLLWITWRERNFAHEHQNETIEITPQGVSYRDGESEIRANWDEVRAIRFVPGRRLDAHYRVETQNGDFTVWKALETIEIWTRLVQQFAPQLNIETPVIDPDLGDESQAWSGKKVGEGARIFHFRTRDTRLVLWAVTVSGIVVPLLPFLMQSMKTPDDDPTPLPWEFWAIVLFLAVLAVGYGWLCFARAAIWADETGLEWRVPFFKTRRVNWSEIAGFGHEDFGYFLRTPGGKRKIWLLSAPVRQKELLQVIAVRATDATGKWDG